MNLPIGQSSASILVTDITANLFRAKERIFNTEGGRV